MFGHKFLTSELRPCLNGDVITSLINDETRKQCLSTNTKTNKRLVAKSGRLHVHSITTKHVLRGQYVS